MDVALPVPEDGKCAPLPAPPGCDRPVHACAYGFRSYGSGGGSSGSVLSVCAGVVATVCTDNKAKKPKRVVHEVVPEPQ